MEIKLRGLDQGEHNYSVSEPAEIYALEPGKFPEFFHSDITVDVQSGNYYIAILTRTNVKFVCDRCMDDFMSPYTVEVRIIYTEDPTLDPEQQQENLYFLPAGKDMADLSEDVRQSVLVNLPMKTVCKETCRGLCDNCGTNLNEKQCNCIRVDTDNQWDALKKLQL